MGQQNQAFPCQERQEYIRELNPESRLLSRTNKFGFRHERKRSSRNNFKKIFVFHSPKLLFSILQRLRVLFTEQSHDILPREGP